MNYFVNVKSNINAYVIKISINEYLNVSGNRKALVEKSGLVKHATNPRKTKESQKASGSDGRSASNR